MDAMGLKHAGTARTAQEAGQLTTFDVKGVKVALLAYGYGLNGFQLPKDQPWAVNPVSYTHLDVYKRQALDVSTPLYTFLFLVALGVDYNIFLVTRAREETPAHGSREGMLRALAATGGLITSAGILLAAVFAVLGLSLIHI